MIFSTDDHAYPCCHICTQDAVIDIGPSGEGSFPDMAENTQSHFDMLFISDNLAESLADAD
jgi:hypothetical protein